MRKIHLGHNILDHQLLDKDGRRCGNVDDLAIEDANVVAILSGPGYWPSRAGWLGRLAARLGGSGRVRIPWDEVAKIDSAVHLRRAATEYGLGKGDDRLRPFLERIPGAHR
jgi:sporulation protein YlmC with PRC-barrel domain